MDDELFSHVTMLMDNHIYQFS